MATIDLMDRFVNLGSGGIRNNGTLDAEAMFQPSLRTMRTDFIQVKAGDSIVYKNMNGMSSSWNIISFYTGDAQGYYVSGIAGQTTPQSGVWTAQQDGYVRLFGSFPAGDNISVTMTDLAPDVEDYLAKYNAMNYRFLPNSIPKIVAHIQEYLSNHPIADSTTLQAVIDAAFQSYLEEIQETADNYIAEAVPPAASAAVDAAASPALAEITAKAAEAAESARQAGLSQQSAEMSEENALTYRNQAQQIKDSITAEVAASVQAAQEQATLAQESAQAADQSADTAEQYVALSRAQAEAAAAQAQTASGYASDAQGYMQNASDYADAAAQSAATFTTDPTLTIAGKAADAKATGDQLSDLKSALDAHFQGVNIIESIVSGSFSGSNYTIASAQGGSIVCFPVVSGKKYTIVKPNTTAYWRIGYSEDIPAIGTTLTNYNNSASVSALYATFTAPISGYIAAFVSNSSEKETFDSGVYAYDGEYNESYDIHTATLINTNVPVNINERLNQTDVDISALEAKYDCIENKICFAYTDNDVINSNIRDCKVQITSDSVKKIVIDFPNNATTYLNVITYDANDTQLNKKSCAYSVFYDADSKLLLVKTSDYLIRMIIDLDFVSENHPAYTGAFGSPAFGNSKLFDEQNYPYDRHITDFAPSSSGDPLTAYMLLRSAIKEIYISGAVSITAIDLLNGNNIRFKNGSTIIITKTLTSGYKGTVLIDDYCAMYVDFTNVGAINLSNVIIAKTGMSDNLEMSSPHVFYCGKNREITTLKSGIEAAMQYMDSVLYVDDGTYDLIEEFGDDYFANLPDTDQQAGLKLGNRIRIIFSSNSKVIANYTGDNPNVCTCFSPINNGGVKMGFTLENLTLYSSRTRYAVHDVGGLIRCKNKYINCHIEQDNSNNTYWPQSCAIGAGLGANQETEVSNCVFKGQVYWHLFSGESSNYKGRVQCVNNYFINNTVQVSASRSDAENNTEFVITGNSFVPVSASDADGIVRTFVDNASAIVYAWDNEVRQ